MDHCPYLSEITRRYSQEKYGPLSKSDAHQFAVYVGQFDLSKQWAMGILG